MKHDSRPPAVYAYVRLSREELAAPGATEEKLERHRTLCRGLAARHGLTLPPENIVEDIGTGSKLAARAGFLRILELARCGRLTHLLASFQDRLARASKADELVIEDALYEGCVTVITTEGVSRYDDDLDPLPAEVRALVARHELRMYARRRRENNRARLARNQRTSGFAPYGYRKDAQAPGGYAIIPHEYETLEEIFRRVLAGASLRSVHRWLNDAGIPPPSVGRRARPAAKWDFSTLYDLVHRPIYAGYHARVSRPLRGGGSVSLSPDDFELAGGEEGAWPHPITLADWYAIRARYAAYRQPAYPRTALLTGILCCERGTRMHAAGAGRSYGCLCQDETHYAHRTRMDELARRVFVRFVAQAAARALDVPLTEEKPRDRAALSAQLARATRDMAEREQDVRAMLTDADRQRRLLGDDLYESVLVKARGEWEAAKRTAEALRDQLQEPDLADARRLLDVVNERGAERVWDRAEVAERRTMLQTIVRRIVLDAPTHRGGHRRGGHIEWQEWVTRCGLEVENVPAEWWKRQRRERGESEGEPD